MPGPGNHSPARRGGPPRRSPPRRAPRQASPHEVPAPATEKTKGDTPEPERLQRTLARAGYGSRRSVEELIRQDRVQVDGRPARLGQRVDPATASISVNGVPVPAHPGLRYYALHKPPGVTTTLRDPHAERSLASFIPAGPRVFPVGRLDRDSEGLLLLTNDGGLAHRLQHPRFGVEKEYLVEVEGALSADSVRRLARGIPLDDGIARALAVGRVERSRGRSSVSLVMGEGRNREVRRMFQAIGHAVTRLVRIRMGPVRLDRLPPGGVRELEPEEIISLYRTVGLRNAHPRGRGRSDD